MKKRILTFCASLAFLLVISGGVDATIVRDFTLGGAEITPSAGVIPVPGSKGTTVTPVGTFTHELLFRVASNADLLQATLASPAGFLGGAAATVTLFQEDTPFGPPLTTVAGAFGGAGSVVASFATVLGNDVYSLTAQLAGIPARYFIRVAGTTSGTGTYSVQLTTTTVPLPPAVVLFLSALAGLAGFSRIRRRKVAA